MKPLLTAFILLLATALPALAGGVTVTDAWARATPPGAVTGAVYLSLTAATPDALIGAATPAAASASVHESRVVDGIMRMLPVPHLALPAGQPVILHPNGLHIMLENLNSPLKEGGTITLHLTFAHASPQDITAAIRPIGAGAPAMTMEDMK